MRRGPSWVPAAVTVLFGGALVTASWEEEPVNDDEPLLGAGALYESTRSESRTRASLVLPSGPSEDASYVLGRPPSFAAIPTGDAPNESVQWVVEIARAGNAPISREQVLAVLDRAWLDARDRPWVRGRHEGRWRYVGTRDAPPSCDALRVAWGYLGVGRNPNEALDLERARAHLAASEAAASALGATASARVDAESAVRRARELGELATAVDVDVALLLVAPERETYEGVALWDALESLGLEWGDGDYFHWNGGSGDALFSVGTTSPPGYFFPEQAAAGRLRVRDLDFGFGLASTPDPLRVWEAMLRAARYAQGRLGGEIVGADGEPLDEMRVRAEIAEAVQRMERAGVPAGSYEARLLF